MSSFFSAPGGGFVDEEIGAGGSLGSVNAAGAGFVPGIGDVSGPIVSSNTPVAAGKFPFEAIGGAAFGSLVAASAMMQIAAGGSARAGAQAEANNIRAISFREETDTRRANNRLFAAQQVAFAASGVDPGSGSPLDVLADSVAEAELAILRSRFTRETEARSLEAQGKSAQLQGITGGISTILGGGAAALGAFG